MGGGMAIKSGTEQCPAEGRSCPRTGDQGHPESSLGLGFPVCELKTVKSSMPHQHCGENHLERGLRRGLELVSVSAEADDGG